jgi:hypothetical protein
MNSDSAKYCSRRPRQRSKYFHVQYSLFMYKVVWLTFLQDLLVEVWQDRRVIKKFLKRKRDNFNSIRGYHAQEAERRWKLHIYGGIVR